MFLTQTVTAIRSRRIRLKAGFVSSLILFIAVCTLAVAPMSVRGQTPREYQIKAAFIHNFVKFIEWPAHTFPEKTSPVILCIIGKDPFGAVLESMMGGKTIKGRGMVIRRFERIEDLGHCHILFVSSSERGSLTQILVALQGLSLLTIGEMDAFAESGGIINFILKRSRIRFEINVDAAALSGLKISSKLLSLATVVRNTPHTGSE